MRHRLEAAGKGRCAAIDMTRIGSQQLTQEQWYQGLAFDIARQLRLPYPVNVALWWQALGDLPPVQKLSQFIETVLLAGDSPEPLFIFLDKINSVRFATTSGQRIRPIAVSPGRFWGSRRPATWCKVISRCLSVLDRLFTLRVYVGGSGPISNGTGRPHVTAGPPARRGAAMVGGQSFLTQKVCGIVRSHLIDHWEAQDEPEHLRTIRDRLVGNPQRASRVLSSFQGLLHQSYLQANGSQDKRT